MAIQPYKPSQGVQGTKAFAAAKGFAMGGPVGAGVALAGANNPGLGSVAQIGMNAGSQDKSAYQRRMEQTDQSGAMDPSNPVHVETINQGLSALPDSGLPKEQQDYLASLMIAGYTHGRNGMGADHLFNEPTLGGDASSGEGM